MCVIAMHLLSFQFWIAKNCISVCLDLPIGFFALMISVADRLSSQTGVGPFSGVPNSDSTDLTHCMFFAAATAAIDSALVELSAIVDHSLDWHSTATSQCVMACPVVDLLFAWLFPQAASVKHTNLESAVSMRCIGNLVFVPVIVCMGESGNPADSSLLWHVTPQSSVVLRHSLQSFSGISPVVVMCGRIGCTFEHQRDCMSNIRTASDTCKHYLSKECPM